MSDHLTELEARIEQARADYDAIQGYEESSLTERIALQHAAAHVYPLTNELEATAAVIREVKALHCPRTVYANESHCTRQGDHAIGRHIEDRTGSWVCLDMPLADECRMCTSEDGATADWPCPTAAAVETWTP